MGKKLTYEFVKESFEKEGYTLLSTEYKNKYTKLEYICPNGHKHSIDWSHWKFREQRCPYCTGSVKLTYHQVKESFEKEGYTLLSTEYKGNKAKLEYICSNNHKHSITWNDWQAGHRCPYCAGKGKPTIEQVQASFESEDYILISTEYTNNNTKLDYVCPKGHKHQISWSEWQQGHRCFYCRGSEIAKDKVPLFKTYANQIDFAEEVREFIDDKERILLQVKCKYCQEWFVPITRSVLNRIASLVGRYGGENNFYCSQECKDSCPTYNTKIYPKGFTIDEDLPYTQHELNIWAETVKAKFNYTCEMCGALATDAHHIKPKKLFPNEALDPENGAAYCHDCHIKYGHNGECSTGSLANIVCSLNSSTNLSTESTDFSSTNSSTISEPSSKSTTNSN